jgi:hypothetical protein
MADDPRSYLLDRFASDAATLRERAAQLAGKPSPAHGPDAVASERMAEACDHVGALLTDLSEHVLEQLAALDELLPRLAALAERAEDAFVRSVYGGAATRISDIVAKERAALGTDDPDDTSDDGDGNDDDDDLDADEAR